MITKFTYLLLIPAMFVSCKKYLEIDKVEDEFLVEHVFSSDSAANSAVAGIYRNWRDLYNSSISPSILCGLSGDELQTYFSGGFYEEFYQNRIRPQSQILPWAPLYNTIYQANAVIESLANSTAVSEKHSNFYTGEAKFIRAHCYFNLINIFGDVPLLTSTDIQENSIAKRQPKEAVWNQIITDLKDADSLLMDSPLSFNERVNSFAAKALLARVYLFTEDWEAAIAMADFIIQSQRYKLEKVLDSIFIKGSLEAIFQFSNTQYEGNLETLVFIPTGIPTIVCSKSLINSFEVNDERKLKWIKSAFYLDDQYFYPFKYKASELPNQERYILFRLAEQFLIRAEAHVHVGNLSEAIKDLNVIRARSGLPELDDNMDTNSCLNAVMQERRVELFAETGHRWFDLKRTGLLNGLMSIEKGDLWVASDSLYPIPASDIQRNPNLVQNANY